MNLATIIDEPPDGHTALVAGMDRISYGRLRDAVARQRAVLLARGLEPGDRVAIVCGTSPRFVTAWLAVVGAGLVAVPLNPSSPAPELADQLATTGARAVIAGPAGAAVLADVDPASVPALDHVLTPAGSATGDDLDALTEAAEPAGVVDVDPDHLAALMFTSGTAGSPRAAMLSHANLAADLRQVQAHPARAVRPDDVVLCVVPLFHILGLNTVLDLALYAGATIVLLERFDPVSTLETVAAESVTALVGPPAMWAALAEVDDPPLDALARLRIAVSGAAPLPRRVADTVRERLGIGLHQGYGLTEASPSVSISLGTGAPVTSVGRPLAGVEVRLVDRDGDDALVGDPGEIWVRGPNVFQGYWNDPEATAGALDPAGWLHTGDIGLVDDDGYLYVVDRAKDLVIVSGFNVYPAEVERVLVAHPAVAEAAVVGVPHPHTGEAVKAFVVPAEGSVVEEDELVEWVAARLARYKCPTKIDVVDEIPRGLTGKVLRRSFRGDGPDDG